VGVGDDNEDGAFVGASVFIFGFFPWNGSDIPEYGMDMPEYGNDMPGYDMDMPGYGMEMPGYRTDMPNSFPKEASCRKRMWA
jgi:hypothetical protein